MRDRPASPPRASARACALTVDVALFSPREHRIGVLAQRPGRPRSRETWSLPWAVPRAGEHLAATARRVLREVAGRDAAWLEQVGAFADGLAHPSGRALSVCFVGVVPDDGAERLAEGATWRDPGTLALGGRRQRQMLGAALETLRTRMDFAPVPFHLLPSRFTLSELQRIYELLLDRRLHKASFRRALHSAWVVAPTDEWRREGRGRPAQLFRFAPRGRRAVRRTVRFTLP